MTTTPFKIDLMLRAMGMKRFTSHRRTPITIRVNRIERRGIILVPFCLCCETLLARPRKFPPTAWCRERDKLIRFDGGLDHRTRQAGRFTCCSGILRACEAAEIKLKKMDWPAQQSLVLLSQAILHRRQDVCLFTYRHFRSLFEWRAASGPAG